MFNGRLTSLDARIARAFIKKIFFQIKRSKIVILGNYYLKSPKHGERERTAGMDTKQDLVPSLIMYGTCMGK